MNEMPPPHKTKRFSTPDRFWAQLNKQGPSPAHRPELGPCWVWAGRINERGYGTVTYQRKTWRAHRLAYTLAYGTQPHAMYVCHHCDNPPCCNPAHLFLGTQAENMEDCKQKGRVRNGSADAPDGERQWSATARIGERQWSAKLTDDLVREIRVRYAAGGVTQRQLAADYGVAQPQIKRAILRHSWKHVI